MEARVTVAVLTYNLENYVREALESILRQRTSFPVKIIIADDASSDTTPQILQEYKEKYPDIIELILAKKNGGCSANALRLYERLDTEYFAVLDGDDLWASQDKLQHQVEFLDNNPQYTMCSGQTKYIIDGKVGNNILPNELMGISYAFRDYFYSPILFHVSGLLYRNVVFKDSVPQCFYSTLNTFEDCATRGEDIRRMLHLEKGPLYVLPELVSYYRIHEMGIWSGSSSAKKVIETAITQNFIKKHYKGQYQELQEVIKMRADIGYQGMWATLINEKYIFPENKLSLKETHMLTAYLMDMKQQEENECILR